MRELARKQDLTALIAPVRPSWKDRYPLVPIEQYATWRRSDGTLFDPWMRVHERAGAAVLRPEPESLRITDTVAEWEECTQMAFPASGEYWFPGGLATVSIDRDADSGRYFEPNVWLRHEVCPIGGRSVISLGAADRRGSGSRASSRQLPPRNAARPEVDSHSLRSITIGRLSRRAQSSGGGPGCVPADPKGSRRTSQPLSDGYRWMANRASINPRTATWGGCRPGPKCGDPRQLTAPGHRA